MSTPLLHSPADVTRWVLITVLGVATDPAANGAWPAFVSSEPSDPDNCITVTDTTPVSDARLMPTGERMLHYGVQVRVRSTDHPTGFVKAEAVRRGLDEGINGARVTLGGTTYAVACYSRVNGPLSIGKNVPATKRSLFTVNAMVSLRALP